MQARIHTTMARINILLAIANVFFFIGAITMGHIFGAIAALCFTVACAASCFTHGKQAVICKKLGQ